MKNLIIIPAYNESGNIEKTIADIEKNAPDFDYVIINDCSTDNTLEICKKNHFSYLNLPVNLGIGGAVQTGYRYAYYNGYDTATQFDGDGQHDAAYLSSMLEKLQADECDMVIGSRFIEKEGFQSNAVRRVGIKWLSGLIKLFSGGKRITDPTSGMRMVSRNLMKLYAEDYPIDYPEPESTMHALSKKFKVCEVPVKMKERMEGKSSISLKGGAYYMLKVSIAIIFASFKR